MNVNEYRRYSEELKKNGYEYRKDCPYDGNNMWVKFPRDGDRDSVIQMDVYHGINVEGTEYYNVKPHVILRRRDCECGLRLTIDFDTNNIIDIESMFEKYYEKMI